jgi:hypothetical protein
MFQQTDTTLDHDNKIAYKANRNYAQSFVRILQIVWSVICNISAILLSGFHSFVRSAEQNRPQQHDYWWDSPEVVDDLFQR